MALYYTIHDGGHIQPLPTKNMHQKIIKKLIRNRNKIKERSGENHSHLKVVGISFPHRIHSLFVITNNKIKRIWDSNNGKYRNIKKHSRKVPQEIMNEIISNKNKY